jgi:hypothetical protein
MTRIADAHGRLQRDEGLPALLDAAYVAFEVLLSAIEDRQDPAGGMFTQFVYAATATANGRDAILFAPSLPARPLHPADANINGRGSSNGVSDLAALSKVLYQVLIQAAAAAPGEEDRKACHHAARYAAEIHQLLTGAKP